MYILFDLDNTLINRDKAYEKWLFSWLKQQGVTVTPLSQDRIKIEDNHGYTARTDFYNWLIHTYQLKVTIEEIMKEASIQIHEYVSVISPNIKQLIVSLQKQHTVGIVTNGGVKNQLSKIKAADISMILPTHIFISEAVGISKPEMNYFIHVETQLKASKEDIVIVGDNLNTDIIGGKAAGWKTIWLTSKRKAHHPAADHIITNLTALKNIF